MKYIHTIGGRVATYYRGEQICYHSKGRTISYCKDLNQIKREQRASNAWRVGRGVHPVYDYGYTTVSRFVLSKPLRPKPAEGRR